MKKFAGVLMIAAMMATGSTQVQSAPETVTICYYGVTQQVSQKLAVRYMKLGATLGPCVQED